MQVTARLWSSRATLTFSANSRAGFDTLACDTTESGLSNLFCVRCTLTTPPFHVQG